MIGHPDCELCKQIREDADAEPGEKVFVVTLKTGRLAAFVFFVFGALIGAWTTLAIR